MNMKYDNADEQYKKLLTFQEIPAAKQIHY